MSQVSSPRLVGEAVALLLVGDGGPELMVNT